MIQKTGSPPLRGRGEKVGEGELILQWHGEFWRVTKGGAELIREVTDTIQ